MTEPRGTAGPLELAGLGISAMLVPLGSTMIAVALPGIGAEFHRTPSELTHWLVNSYLIVNILALVPAGRLGDRWGYRKTLSLGQFLFGVGCLLPIAWPAFEALVAARVLMALGGALMVPTVMALFRIAVPADRLHRVFGYFGAMMGIAAAIGPSLGGLLVHHFGWPSIFVMNLPPLLLSAFFAASFFRSRTEGHRSASATPGWAATAVAFFRTPAFTAGCMVVALLNLGMYTLLFELPYLLQLRYQWGAGQSGPWMTAFMISMMAGSAIGGRLAERRGPRTACLSGSLCSAAGFAWLALSPSAAGQMQVVASLVLAGGGLGLAGAPSQSAALGSVDRAMSGVASGVIWIARYLGGVVGITMLASLLAAPGGAQSLAQHHRVVLVLAASLLLAAVVSLWLPGRPRSA